MNSILPNYATPTNIPQESNFLEKKHKGRRGKASTQKRVDAYRDKKGTVELDNYRAGIRERTFADIDLEEGLAMLKQMAISKSKQQVQLPVTTRAAGFIANEVVEYASAVANRAVLSSGITPIIEYRVTLLQIEAQQQASLSLQSVQDDIQSSKQVSTFNYENLQIMKSAADTFSVLSAISNGCGVFTDEGTQYMTHVPDLSVVDMDIEAGAAKRQAGGAEVPVVQRQRTRRVIPHPHYITIKNLREVAEALADEQTPMLARQYFRDNNPIPGAQWENNLLVNIDEIMPLNYFQAVFHQDIRKHRNFIASARSKLGPLIGRARMDGVGNTSPLITAYQFEGFRLDGDILLTRDCTTFRTNSPLMPDQRILLGALTLLGEVPSNVEIGLGWGRRDPTQAVGRIDVNWHALLNLAFNSR